MSLTHITSQILLADEALTAIIPQKPSMVMIDKLHTCTEMETWTGLHIKAENIFSNDGKFSASGLIENMAQTAAARSGYGMVINTDPNAKPVIGFIGAIKNAKITLLPPVDATITTQVSIKNEIFGVTLIEAKVYYQEEVIAQCEMKIVLKSE